MLHEIQDRHVWKKHICKGAEVWQRHTSNSTFFFKFRSHQKLLALNCSILPSLAPFEVQQQQINMSTTEVDTGAVS
jgi:hypothetical protein